MKKISALVLGLIAAASFTSAAGLTQSQIDSILGLLRSFGADQSVIANVEASLKGETPTATTTTTTTGGEATTTTTGNVVYKYHPNIDYEFTKYIYYGSRGHEVEMLQKVLASYGAGKADGIYGRMTERAVKAFQRATGLQVDGKVGPATRAKLNEKEVVATTTTDNTNNETTTTETEEAKLSVSAVASDDMIAGPNQIVILSDVTVKAGEDDIKVKDFYLKWNNESASRDNIAKVYLLDAAGLPVDDDTIDSSNEAKVKADVKVKAGEEAKFKIAILTAGSVSTGLNGYLTVTKVTTANGDEIDGTPFKTGVVEFNNDATVAEYTPTFSQDKNGSVKIGERNVKVATLTIKNEGRDGDDYVEYVKAIKIRRTGSAGDDDLENIKVKVSGKTYDAVQDTDDKDEYEVTFGNGIKLEDKGDDEDFAIYTDIADGADKDFKFEVIGIVLADADGVVLKSTNNVDENNPLQTSDSAISIDTSEVVLHKTNDVSGHKVAADAKGAELGSFDVKVTGSDVEGDLEVTIKASGADVEGNDAAVDVSDIDLDNLAIYTKSGDRISDKENTSFAVDTTEDDVVTYTVKFDDVKFESSDRAEDFVIKGDISKDAPDGTKYEITEIKYTSVEDEDNNDITVLPETISSPATIEVEATDLDVSVEDADDKNVNSDTDGVEVAKIKLDATNSGDDVKVSQVKLVFKVVSSTADENDITNCEIFDGSNSVTSQEDAASTPVTFDFDNEITVAKGTEKRLSVRCDLGVDFANEDKITVYGAAFKAKGAVTDTDVDQSVVDTPVTTDDNTFDDTSADVTITDGTLEVTKSSDDVNDDKVVKDNTDDVVLGQYKIKAKDRELKLATIKATLSGETAIDGKVDLYINGSKEDSQSVNTTDHTVEFTNLDKTIAKDATAVVEFKADTKSNTTGEIQITKVDAETVEDIVANSDGTVNYDGSTSETGPVVTVVEAIPVVTQVDTNTSNLESADDVVLFTYKVKADGDDINLGKTVFNVTATNANLTNVKVKVYDNASMSGSKKAEETLNDVSAGETKDLEANLTSVKIDENDTYYVFLIADVRVTDDIRSVDVKVADEAYEAGTKGFFFDTDDSDAYNAGDLDGSKLIEDDMKALLKKD